VARALRIAQVAPLYERVPPERYGGTERVVSFLTGYLEIYERLTEERDVRRGILRALPRRPEPVPAVGPASAEH